MSYLDDLFRLNFMVLVSEDDDDLSHYSEPDYWPYWPSEDISGDESDDDEEWQRSSGRETSAREKCVSHGRSINLVHFLKKRETGEPASRDMTVSTLLPFALLPRWSAVSERDMLSDANVLLGRKLYRWEGMVLNFLIHQQHAPEKRAIGNAGLRKDALPYAMDYTNDIVPVTFEDIVDILLKTGAINLNSTDDSGEDLLTVLVAHYPEIQEDRADFLEFLIQQHGYDVKQTGEKAIRILVDSCREALTISTVTLRILRMLLNAGVELTEASKCELVPKFTTNIFRRASQNAVETLSVLFEFGCRAGQSLITMADDLDLFINKNKFSALRTKHRFEHILRTANMLVDKGAQLNEPSNKDPMYRSFLFKILDHASTEPSHPSMLGFLKHCFARGFDANASTSFTGMNLLMAFCTSYKHEDLPDVIRFLCSSGIDVNATVEHGGNVLFYLASNEPVYRETIYEAAQALVQLNIDVTSSSNDYTAFRSFLDITIKHHCCHYKNLKSLTESRYWDMLTMLFVGKLTVNQVKTGVCFALQMFIAHWRNFDSFYDYEEDLYGNLDDNDDNFWDENSICNECLMRVVPISKDDARATLRRAYFDKTFELIRRLIEPVGLNCTISKADEHPMYYVCRHFKGDQLIALVKLLCENGLNLSERPSFEDFTGEVRSMDFISFLLLLKESQAHLANQLIEIMTPNGYQPDDETRQLLFKVKDPK